MRYEPTPDQWMPLHACVRGVQVLAPPRVIMSIVHSGRVFRLNGFTFTIQITLFLS